MDSLRTENKCGHIAVQRLNVDCISAKLIRLSVQSTEEHNVDEVVILGWSKPTKVTILPGTHLQVYSYEMVPNDLYQHQKTNVLFSHIYNHYVVDYTSISVCLDGTFV